MVTKYCPLKRLGMCGKCKSESFSLKDEFAEFPLAFSNNCEVTLYNSKILNLVDDLKDIKGINQYRLSFTTESSDEVKRIIKMFKIRLNDLESNVLFFDSSLNTRGHFNKEIM
jgi:putative protease